MIRLTLKDRCKTRVMIAQQGKSLRGFSKEIGISHSYLSQLLNGFRNPSPTMASKIAKGLNTKIGNIFLVNIVANDNPDKSSK